MKILKRSTKRAARKNRLTSSAPILLVKKKERMDELKKSIQLDWCLWRNFDSWPPECRFLRNEKINRTVQKLRKIIFCLWKGTKCGNEEAFIQSSFKNYHANFYHVFESNSTPFSNAIILRGRLSNALPSGKIEDIKIYWLWRYKTNYQPKIKKYQSNCVDLFEGISVHRFSSVFQF